MLKVATKIGWQKQPTTYESLLEDILKYGDNEDKQIGKLSSLVTKLHKKTDKNSLSLEGFILHVLKNPDGYQMLQRILQRKCVASSPDELPWSYPIHQILFTQEELDVDLIKLILTNNYRGVISGFNAYELTALVQNPNVSEELLIKAANSTYDIGRVINNMRPVSLDFLLSLHSDLSLLQLHGKPKISVTAHEAILERASLLEPDLPLSWLEEMFLAFRRKDRDVPSPPW